MRRNELNETCEDLPACTFLILRDHFFDSDGKPKPFKLRDKLHTQDDPLDEYLHNLLASKPDYECIKASPLVSPDLVLYHKQSLSDDNLKEGAFEDLTKILALEVKKLNRTSSGSVARRSGLDYNTTPPCGKVRVYTQGGKSLDIRAFYLFICQEREPEKRGSYKLTALTLCDGNAINMDFDLYLSAVETREKEIELGTYRDGLNRNRPMFVFSNPLGLSEMDHNATLIHPAEDLDEKCNQLGKVFRLIRSAKEGVNIFWCYRSVVDIPLKHTIEEIRDFPTPSQRRKETQSRGRFKLPI